MGWLTVQYEATLRTIRYWQRVVQRVSAHTDELGSSLLKDAMRVQVNMVLDQQLCWMYEVMTALKVSIGRGADRFITAVKDALTTGSLLLVRVYDEEPHPTDATSVGRHRGEVSASLFHYRTTQAAERHQQE